MQESGWTTIYEIIAKKQCNSEDILPCIESLRVTAYNSGASSIQRAYL